MGAEYLPLLRFASEFLAHTLISLRRFVCAASGGGIQMLGGAVDTIESKNNAFCLVESSKHTLTVCWCFLQTVGFQSNRPIPQFISAAAAQTASSAAASALSAAQQTMTSVVAAQSAVQNGGAGFTPVCARRDTERVRCDGCGQLKVVCCASLCTEPDR
jgi:hypothetical protein